MRPLFARLFLLFLLACDWAADPTQGTSALSTTFASSEVAPLTLGFSPKPVKCPAHPRGPVTLALAVQDAGEPPLLLQVGEPHATARTGADLVYLYHTILC
jgi:hypothetical protein